MVARLCSQRASNKVIRMLGPQIRLWIYRIIRRYRNMGDCIFCKLANGEIPTDMVYEDDKIAVFRDASPQAPVHMLMVPKVHIASLDDLSAENAELMGHMMLKIKEVAAQEGLDNGYRCVINTGEDGQQTVKHLHIHILGKRSMQWPPG